MSVTSYEPINDYREGSEAYQEGDGTSVTTSSKAWRVYTSSATDDEHDVFAYALLPKIGTAHPGDAASRCIRRTARPESHGQKKHWIFVAEYSDKWEIEENPLDDPAKTEWSTETFQTPVWETVDGKGIVNSAGDPFDPPAEKDDSRWTSITRKNIPDYVPTWIFAYQDCVNSDSYTLDGVTIPAGYSKISAISLGESQSRNDVAYRVLSLTIHHRGENEGTGSGSGSYGSGSGSDEINPWDLNLLDAGMREIPADGDAGGTDGRRNILNAKDGLPVSSPVPLDGEGHAIDEPTLDNCNWIQFQVYFEKAFGSLSSVMT